MASDQKESREKEGWNRKITEDRPSSQGGVREKNRLCAYDQEKEEIKRMSWKNFPSSSMRRTEIYMWYERIKRQMPG